MAKIAVEHIDEEQQQATEIEQTISIDQGVEIDKKQNTPVLIFVILLLIVGGITYLWVDKTQSGEEAGTLPAQQTVQLTEAEQLHQKLRQIVDLPGETPNLATVMDAEKVKDQLFFSKAENGDKVLIYVNAGQAVLYRPTTGKVINLAPIQLDAKASQGVR